MPRVGVVATMRVRGGRGGMPEEAGVGSESEGGGMLGFGRVVETNCHKDKDLRT